MRTTLLIWALALGVGAVSASARLGETRAECITRYGTPVETNETELIFRKNALSITVKFDDQGHSIELRFHGAPLEHWQAGKELVHRNLGNTEEKHGASQWSWFAGQGGGYAHWVAGSLVIRSAEVEQPPEAEQKKAHEDAERWKSHQKETMEKLDGF